MREILFRSKRVDNDEWAYGYLVKMWGALHIIDKDNENIAYEIKPETIEQFTGLTDKNGQKIFEGDIVRYCDEDAYYYPEDCTEFFGTVVQEFGAFGIGTDKELPLELENWCNNDNFVSLWEIYWNLNCCDGELPMLEVVGNSHDNPELLE